MVRAQILAPGGRGVVQNKDFIAVSQFLSPSVTHTRYLIEVFIFKSTLLYL